MLIYIALPIKDDCMMSVSFKYIFLTNRAFTESSCCKCTEIEFFLAISSLPIEVTAISLIQLNADERLYSAHVRVNL